MSQFHNTYDDANYAESYARLEWEGTYQLVRRDLPGILREHVTGRRALDFGCGTGRSTRLLRACGFEVVGIDIATSMIERAKALDPEGDYRLIHNGDLARLPSEAFDLVLAAFPFDNTPMADKPRLLGTLRDRLDTTGRIVNVVSSPEIYVHEWASFSTRRFPENRRALDGDVVRIVTTAFPHGQPCEDVLCTDRKYRQLYADAGLEVIADYRPIARGDEEVPWVSETRVAPWVIWVLGTTIRGATPP
jgi:ubiquinone/menaquinone biosynthesis C-methylase UbiE